MKILVAGATGKTGTHLVDILLSNGHDPIALVRESSDTSALPAAVTLRQGDLADLSDDVCSGCDAVIFAAGSGGDTGQDMTGKIDRDGAMRLIDIAAKSGVSRFVMLSSVGADNPQAHGDMSHYLQAKHDADEHLKASGLPFAILRPVALTDDASDGNMKFGDAVDPSAEAARSDVARALATALDDDGWIGKTKLMQSA